MEFIFVEMQRRNQVRAYARRELMRTGLLDENAQVEDRLVCSFDEVRLELDGPEEAGYLGHTTVRMRYSCFTTGSGWSHAAEVVGRTRCQCTEYFDVLYVAALSMEAWMRDLAPALARHLSETRGARAGAGRTAGGRGA